MVFKKSQVVKMGFCLVVGVLLFSGCAGRGSSDDTTDEDASEHTVISYSIDGETITGEVNKTFPVGSTVTIEAQITGPEAEGLGVAWGYVFQGGSFSFPISTDTSASVSATSAGNMVITGSPNYTHTLNGEELIEGSVTVNITFE